MLTVIGVRFRAAGKIYYFDPADRQIKIGDHVIVETARGIEYGYVVLGNREVDETKVIPPLKPVIRMATDEDRAIEAKNKEKEKEAFEKAKEAGELVVMISTAENNARVMKSCMKEAREAAEFLRDEKNDVEEWQLAGINAMFDQCNKENMVPYDMPTAIKGLLCMQYQ